MNAQRLPTVVAGFVVLGLITTGSLAATIYVPDDHGTIQAAIDAADPNDTVIVRDGTYTGSGNRNVIFGGKTITVRSENGPVACIIDCQNAGRAFLLIDGEGPNTLIEGFTIRRGSDQGDGGGGAILCDQASPTVRDCVFVECHATSTNADPPYRGGGAMNCVGGSPYIAGCTFTSNSVNWYEAGAIEFWDSPNAHVTGCVFNGNSTETTGGAITNNTTGGPPPGILHLTDCVFTGNIAHWTGGALSGGAVAITRCRFVSNSAPDYPNFPFEGWGGAAFLLGPVTITESAFVGNTAGGLGGALWCAGEAEIVNCLFAGNTAGDLLGEPTLHGGALDAGTTMGGSTVVRNCTIADNSAGLQNYNGSSLTVTNCVLWGNGWYDLSGNMPMTVSYSDIGFGGWPGVGNIAVDPLFVDPAADDYHLAPGSPCIDTGDPAVVMEPGWTDLDRELRVWDGDGDGLAIVDMGSDEFGSYRYGDMNCDGSISFADINPFVLALGGQAGYEAAYPNCNWHNADVNADGNVNFADINPFVALLGGG